MHYDDDEAIAQLTDNSGDGVLVSYESIGNPFRLATSHDLFRNREEENRRIRTRQTQSRRLSLVQRSESVTSHLPPCRFTPSRSKTSPLAFSSADILNTTKRKPRTKHNQIMPEFIQQKRDIFMVQLFIDRKNREIKKYEQDQHQIERASAERETTISEKSTKYKLAMNALEARLARCRKNSQLATQRHAQLVKELQASQQNVSVMKSNISRIVLPPS